MFDVLAINETSLDFTVGDRKVHMDGCKIVLHDRAVFYICNCITFSVRNDLSLMN